jgi:hypothetical protein
MLAGQSITMALSHASHSLLARVRGTSKLLAFQWNTYRLAVMLFHLGPTAFLTVLLCSYGLALGAGLAADFAALATNLRQVFSYLWFHQFAV